MQELGLGGSRPVKQLAGWLWEKFYLGCSAGPSLRAYGSAPAGCWRMKSYCTCGIFLAKAWS